MLTGMNARMSDTKKTDYYKQKNAARMCIEEITVGAAD